MSLFVCIYFTYCMKQWFSLTSHESAATDFLATDILAQENKEKEKRAELMVS